MANTKGFYPGLLREPSYAVYIDKSNETNTNDSAAPESDEKSPQFVAKFKLAQQYLKEEWTLSYYFFVGVLFPILFLICICFLCGAIIASFESNGTMGIDRIDQLGESPDGEKSTNDAAIADMFNDFRRQGMEDKMTIEKISLSGVSCLNETFNSLTLPPNMTAIAMGMAQCMAEAAMDIVQPESDFKSHVMNSTVFVPPFFGYEESPLRYDWTNCKDADDEFPLRWVNQAQYGFTTWLESYQTLFMKYQLSGVSIDEAHELALKEASGHNDCGTHVAGGSMFWFYIMTTVGMGNRILISYWSRLLVIVGGMISIYLFGTVTFQISQIITIAFDHFVSKHKCLERLSKGWLAAFFWFSLVWLVVPILATFVLVSATQTTGKSFDEVEELLPFRDMFWYQTITMLTIGLGDFFVVQANAEFGHLFVVPVLQLIGFAVIVTSIIKIKSAFAGSDNVEEKRDPVVQETNGDDENKVIPSAPEPTNEENVEVEVDEGSS